MSRNSRREPIRKFSLRFSSTKLSFEGKSYVKLIFPSLTKLWQIYQVKIDAKQNEIPLMRFNVPWSNEDLYNLISEKNPSKLIHRSIRLKMHRSRKFSGNNSSVSLEIFFGRKSTQKLTIEFSSIEFLSQLVRYEIFLLPTYLFTVLCVSLSILLVDDRIRLIETFFRWKIHLSFAVFLVFFSRLTNSLRPNFDSSYDFLVLPFFLYFFSMSFWMLISFFVDFLFFGWFRFFFTTNLLEIDRIFQPKSSFFLVLPFFSIFLFSSSHGQIAMFFISFVDAIYRGTIHRRFSHILSFLLFLQAFLLVFNSAAFIVHVRNLLVASFLPIFIVGNDSTLLPTFVTFFTFSLRFLLPKMQNSFLHRIKLFLQHNGQIICFIVALFNQIFCFYSICYLWIFVNFIFILVDFSFFLRSHSA